MSDSKFQNLADRVRKHRLDQLNQLEETQLYPSPFLTRSTKEIHGKQYAIDFEGKKQSKLEVYHQFDPHHREIEWSYYAEDGEFLLQLSFALEDQSYEVYAAHPGLWSKDQAWQPYLAAIQESLGEHFPALHLVKKSSGEICIELLTNANENLDA